MVHQRSGGDALAIELRGTILSDQGERQVVDTRWVICSAGHTLGPPHVGARKSRGVHLVKAAGRIWVPVRFVGQRVRWQVDRELVVRPHHFDLRLNFCGPWDRGTW